MELPICPVNVRTLRSKRCPEQETHWRDLLPMCRAAITGVKFKLLQNSTGMGRMWSACSQWGGGLEKTKEVRENVS